MGNDNRATLSRPTAKDREEAEKAIDSIERAGGREGLVAFVALLSMRNREQGKATTAIGTELASVREELGRVRGERNAYDFEARVLTGQATELRRTIEGLRAQLEEAQARALQETAHLQLMQKQAAREFRQELARAKQGSQPRPDLEQEVRHLRELVGVLTRAVDAFSFHMTRCERVADPDTTIRRRLEDVARDLTGLPEISSAHEALSALELMLGKGSAWGQGPKPRS